MAMRITYRTLGKLIEYMNDDQLDSDVTVELIEVENRKCYPAELRICNYEHDSLDDGDPVIFVNYENVDMFRISNIDKIKYDIGL